MDVPWGSAGAGKFATNVGLITSNGPHGHDVMACEWTRLVSYSPGLIAANIGFHKATWENISASKEFGVSLAAADQTFVSSTAGKSSGKDVDKIAVLNE